MRLFLFLLLAVCCFAAGALPARSDEAAEKLILATHKLSNEASTASGTVICFTSKDGVKQCAVLTAHHVLDKMRGNSCIIVSRVSRKDGMYGRKEIQVPIRNGARPIWLKHPRHDLALLPLSPKLEIDSLDADSIAKPEAIEDVYVGDSVRLAVFPERAESNNAGFAILRSGSIASFPLVPVQPHPVFLIDTTTWTGDSGGPIIHAVQRSESDGPLIIGIVRGMRSVTDTKRESRFVESRSHYPLGISEVMQASLVWDFVPKDWTN